jgi:hypothetical protein
MVGVKRNLIRCAAPGLLAVLLAALPASAQVVFSDQTAAAGLNHTTDLFFDMNQRLMYCGGAVADFNRDGWPDIFLLGGGGTVDTLFINDGDGTFTEEAGAWGVDLLHRGRGATAGDFNNDGWPDLYVTSGGDMTGGDRVGRHLLYRNNGNGTFTDVAVAAGVNQTSAVHLTPTGAAFGDYDLDGDLDLFVCGWDGVDSNRLFKNNGDETFSDVTTDVGIAVNFYGFSPRFVDMNGDRYPELLVSADFGTSQYFINDGDGTFTRSTTSGTGLDTNGMGSTVADFNRDGLPDWYVTSIYADTNEIQDGNYLYINQGNHQFSALSESAGAKNGGFGWGSDALDCDHDGWVDLVETNGWPPPEWDSENSYIFRNNGDLTFSEVQGGTSGFDHVSQGRSLMLIDYDRDGDMDVLLTGWDEPVALYRNEVSGPNTNWIEIRLDTSGSAGLAPDGYGSRVIATTGTVVQYEWINGGATYLGRSQPVAHFGLGGATEVEITVEWADGTLTELIDVAANQILTIAPTVAGAPGPASPQSVPGSQMKAVYNKITGEIDVAYTPACDASNHTIYFGELANLASYGYTAAACGRGVSGTTSFDPGGLDNVFFLIVGNTGSVEGSYGLDGSGSERPEDTATAGCDLPRDLTGSCSSP